MKWLESAYCWLLWFLGFLDTDGNFQTPKDREKITFMLRRAKERMGIIWYVITFGVKYAMAVAIWNHVWWVIAPLLFDAWLTTHILWAYHPPDSTWTGEKE